MRNIANTMPSLNSDHIILAISVLITAVAVINRLFNVSVAYAQSDALRRHKLYLKVFRVPIWLSLAAIATWFFKPTALNAYQGTLLATILGVGITIFTAEGIKKLAEHKRVKKTFGLLKYITVPYLRSHVESIHGTLKNYSGNLSITHAFLMLGLVSNFDTIGIDFDESWLQLVHSQDFLDALDEDEHYQKIADVEFEVHSFTKNLAAQSIRAKYLLANGRVLIAGNMESQFLREVEQIRDSLEESATNLSKYSNSLEKTVDSFLLQNGVKYGPSQS
jgi:hypothetical protein